MLKNPEMAFRAPELKYCTVEMNHLGQPKARSGNFATVYHGYRPDGSEFAIRVFNRRQDERLEHYRTISDYLESRALSSIVTFDYDERGIRSAGDGKLYPLLIMEWVPGITLFEWTRDRCHEGYAEALQIAADVWLHLVRELQEHQVVHGDLQHGNVMVSPQGHFKLVDYDCMCVPSLTGRRNLETGLPPYQHPGRNADTVLFPGLDNFSALLIYVALRALAVAPHLWITYVDQPEYDRMLFREEDFRTPALSPLYRDLMQSPDEQVRDLTHYLFELVRYDLHDVPPVDEVLLWCESIPNLVAAQEWDKVVQLVQRMGPGEQVAPELQPYLQEAQQRVACRKAVEEALAQGNEERVEQLFATGLLHNYPAAAHLIEPASRAAEIRGVLRILASARQLRSWDKLKSTWLAYQHLLAGRASAKPYEIEVQKLLTLDRLRELLAARPLDPRAVMEAWDYLQELGGHPLADPYREQVELFSAQRAKLKRLEAWLPHAPASPTLSSDKKIVAAAAPEWIQSLDPAAPVAQQYRAASQRLQCVQRVHELEKAGTLEAETYIAGVLQHLPETYHEGLVRRCQQARRRLRAYRELDKAIGESRPESSIAAAWEKLGQVRGRVVASVAIAARAELAVKRLPLLQALRAIPPTLEPAERERRILEIWNEELLGECREAEPWRDVFQRGHSLKSALDLLDQALVAEDLARVESVLAAPPLAGKPLPEDTARRVHELRGRLQQLTLAKRQALVNALLDKQRTAFAELFDAELVREICLQYRHHQPLVRQWVEADLMPAQRIGLATDPQRALVRDEQGNLQIWWNWPPPHISQECRLIVCQSRPAATALPDDVQGLYALTLRREQWQDAIGLIVPFDPAWEGARVVVWAIVDLGFQVFCSEPFEVGVIKPVEAKPRRWGFFRGWRSEKEAKAPEAAESKETQPPETGGAGDAGPPAEGSPSAP